MLHSKFSVYSLVLIILVCLAVSAMTLHHRTEQFSLLHHGANTSTATPFTNIVPEYTPLTELIKPKHGVYPLDPPDVKHVFWTGGLFSTYRILDTILRQNTRVRPVYIVPTGIDRRPSTSDELRSMQAIRNAFEKQHSAHKSLLLDTYLVNIDAIHDEVRRQSFRIFGKRATRMYGAMAQASYEIAPAHSIEWVLSNHTNQERLRSHIVGLVPQQTKNKACIYAGKSSLNKAFASMFQHISFVLPWSTSVCKQQTMTRARARKHGFLNILKKHTWSCWHPAKVQNKTNTNSTLSLLSTDSHAPCNVCAQCISRQNWLAGQ